MELFASGAGIGVTTWLGARARTHVGDADGCQTVAQTRLLARRQHDTCGRREQPKRTDELEQHRVAHRLARRVAAFGGVDAREGDVDLRSPAVALQESEMRQQGERFVTPVTQPQERTYPQVSDAC